MARGAYVREVKGSQDGIRWGSLFLSDGKSRTFQFCRFSGSVTLWFLNGKATYHVEDRNPRRLEEASRLLRAVVGLVTAY